MMRPCDLREVRRRKKRDNSAYKTVRLRIKTHAALMAWVGSATEAYSRGQSEKWWFGHQPTADEAIAELIRRVTAHRERQAKCRRIAKERRAKG